MLTKFWNKPEAVKSPLADILEKATLREELLGVSRVIPPTPEKQLQDLGKVRDFANSADYAVWAKEAWAGFLVSFDKILDPKSSQEEVNFERGRCLATLNLLRIAYKPEQYEGMLKRQAQRQPATPSR